MLKVKPYFPGYLFVKVDLEVVGISTFQWMPFATDLVYCCGKPACVPDRLIAAIQRKLEHINRTTIASALDIDKIKPNDQTDYDEQEYENILDIRLSGKERVEALLQLIEQTGVVLN
jgi:transcription antitermination factor NusG